MHMLAMRFMSLGGFAFSDESFEIWERSTRQFHVSIDATDAQGSSVIGSRTGIVPAKDVNVQTMPCVTLESDTLCQIGSTYALLKKHMLLGWEVLGACETAQR